MCWALGNNRNGEVKKGVDFPNSRSSGSKGTEGSPCRADPRNFIKSWTWRNSKGHGLGRVRGWGVFSTLHLAPRRRSDNCRSTSSKETRVFVLRQGGTGF